MFAKTKGIQKRKRGRMVWDEKEQTWKPRYGYKRANDESNEWVLEHKSSAGGCGQATTPGTLC